MGNNFDAFNPILGKIAGCDCFEKVASHTGFVLLCELLLLTSLLTTMVCCSETPTSSGDTATTLERVSQMHDYNGYVFVSVVLDHESVRTDVVKHAKGQVFMLPTGRHAFCLEAKESDFTFVATFISSNTHDEILSADIEIGDAWIAKPSVARNRSLDELASVVLNNEQSGAESVGLVSISGDFNLIIREGNVVAIEFGEMQANFEGENVNRLEIYGRMKMANLSSKSQGVDLNPL